MCVSGYMLLKIRVCRLDYFLFFELILFAWSTFVNTELVYLHFSVCYVVLQLVVPSFSMAKRYKNTFSKVSFNISCNKNRLETENIFLREESIVRIQKRK